jgi:hypothetical protein
MIDKLTRGPSAIRSWLNRLADIVNKNSKLRGDGIIKVRDSDAGKTIKLDIEQLQARLPKTTGIGGSVLMVAAENAGTGNTIQANLSTNLEGDSLTVTCEICGGSNLNSAIPRITAGKRFYAQWDTTLQTPGYRSIMTFQHTEDCE